MQNGSAQTDKNTRNILFSSTSAASGAIGRCVCVRATCPTSVCKKARSSSRAFGVGTSSESTAPSLSAATALLACAATALSSVGETASSSSAAKSNPAEHRRPRCFGAGESGRHGALRAPAKHGWRCTSWCFSSLASVVSEWLCSCSSSCWAHLACSSTHAWFSRPSGDAGGEKWRERRPDMDVWRVHAHASWSGLLAIKVRSACASYCCGYCVFLRAQPSLGTITLARKRWRSG
eukprot:6202171-Pleurochrysis_carterae.AAC.2